MKKNFGSFIVNRKLLYLICISMLGVLILRPLLYAQTVVQQLWVTNGTVNAVEKSGNTIYIGGSFSNVGPNLAFGIPVNKTFGLPDLRFVMPDGGVEVSIPDGHGGWYIGGNFSSVGGQERLNLARINADGTLHPWNPGVRGIIVYDLLIAQGKLFVAGSFGEVAGQLRQNLVAFDLATGELTPWDPDMSGIYVSSLAAKGNTLYVAGWFWNIGGAPRQGLAALDIQTGLATSWNPLTSNYDYKFLALYGNSVIVGGEFQSLGGQPRLNLGALDATTAQVSSWNPEVNGFIWSLEVDHNKLYVGGKLTSAGGQPRSNLASFDLKKWTLDTWAPQVSDEVKSIGADDGKIYVGGNFRMVNGVPRKHVCAFYAGSGKLAPWTVPVNETVSSISFNKHFAYLGGYYTSIGGEERKNIAAIDATTGRVLPWNPGADGWVYDLLVSNNKLYVAGGFENIAGQSRTSLASFNLVNGQLSSWKPTVTRGTTGANAAGSVTKIVISGNHLYFIGGFRKVGGLDRDGFAAVDATSAAVHSFYPLGGPTDLFDLAVDNGRLYMAGAFEEMAGQPRTGLASFNLATGQITSWNPYIPWGPYGSSAAHALATWNNTIYIGGGFTQANGQPRKGLAAVDGTTGALKDWDPQPGIMSWMNVNDLVTDGEYVYVGTSYINPLLIFDALTAEALDFRPLIMNTNGTGDDGTIESIVAAGDRLYIGGYFSSVIRQPRSFFAGFHMELKDPKLVFFSARVASYGANQEVQCNWSTARDQGLSYFLVERSTDNKNFTSIARIDAHHNSLPLHIYDFTDKDPLIGVSYYRLKMVSQDNREKYSSVSRIEIKKDWIVTIYPSPAYHLVTVELKEVPCAKVDLLLLNQYGHPVWNRKNIQLVQGAGIIQIPVYQLLNGHYLLKVSCGERVVTKAVVVQR